MTKLAMKSVGRSLDHELLVPLRNKSEQDPRSEPYRRIRRENDNELLPNKVLQTDKAAIEARFARSVWKPWG
jgi:hypothetical protein